MEKELYFSLSNRKDKINEWITISKETKSHRPYKLNQDKSALLVLDMQNFFVDKNSHAYVPSVGSIIATINSLISFMSKKKRPIIFTKHITSSKSDDLMRKWWQDEISSENQLSEITHFIDSEKGTIISKNKYSAFYSNEFSKLLKESPVEQLIITGVMSHLCCESTARDAFMNGFEVFFVVDGTATYSEHLHVGTIRSISHGFGICLSSEEILNEE